MDTHREENRVGPFLCWGCSKPLKSLVGVTLREDGESILGLGFCLGCSTKMWSKPVLLKTELRIEQSSVIEEGTSGKAMVGG